MKEERIVRSLYCSASRLSLSARTALPTQANEASTEPHHELGPRTMRLLLSIRGCGMASARGLLEALGERRILARGAAVFSAKGRTAFLALHGEVGLGALGTGLVAGGGTTVASLDAAGFLLVAFLHLADLLPRSLLLFGLLVLAELTASFLDAFDAVAGVCFRAAADAESLVN